MKGWSSFGLFIFLLPLLFLSGCGLLDLSSEGGDNGNSNFGPQPPSRERMGDFYLQQNFAQANEDAVKIDLQVLASLQHDPVAALAYAFIAQEKNNQRLAMYRDIVKIQYSSRARGKQGPGGWDFAIEGLKIGGKLVLGSIIVDGVGDIFKAVGKGYDVDSGGGDILFSDVGNTWSNSGAGDVGWGYDMGKTENFFFPAAEGGE